MDDATSPVRVELLGPLRLLVDGAEVEVRGPKRRAVLALLALAEGRTVPLDTLVDGLWPSDDVESGRQALHSHAFRLRGHLGAAATRLSTQPGGYRLDADGGIDVAEARALLAAARSGRGDDAAPALDLLRRAQSLWRGPVLADLTDVAPVAAAVQACAQLSRDVTDALIACALDAGEAGTVAALAAQACAADPLREPAVLLHMRVLAATGRAPEALDVGREYRRRLTEETGLDPQPSLGDLERSIAAGGRPAPRPLVGGPAPAVGAEPADRRSTPSISRDAQVLIGRDAQVEALERQLTAGRLVTLVGPGGIGKSRVAQEVARRRAPATVVLLATVTAAEAVPHALAAALDLDIVAGDVLAACAAVLADQPTLLVLDNCEHLLGPARDAVARLLASCPDLAVLATSREPLGLAEEHLFRLAPLALPAPDCDLAQVPSVALFLDRARRVRPDLALDEADLRTVGDIARRLDGMPLAIELAAGRLSSFSLADLAARLDRSLDLLGGRPSGDPRHRTLRATVEWSYRLLSEDEQRMFRSLAVFVDGVDLDATEAVGAHLGLASDPGSTLARLVDASVLDVDFSGRTRYRMLETLRAYGLDRLAAAGELDVAEDGLLGWAVGVVAAFHTASSTAAEPAADALLRRELPNLREAWQVARRRSLDDAAAIIIELLPAVAYRDLTELRAWAAELADDPALVGHPHEGAVLGVAAEAAYQSGDQARAERLAAAGLARATEPEARWTCLLPLSVTALARGAYDECVVHALHAARLVTRPSESLGIAALARAYAGDLREARRLNAAGSVGATSPMLLSWAAYVDGEIEALDGRSAVSEQHYRRALDHARAAGATFLVGVATVGLLGVLVRSGRPAAALGGFREVIAYFASTGNWTHQWATLRTLADLLRALDDDGPAALIDAAADAAPDAPADGPRAAVRSHDGPVLGRSAVLDLAAQAIDRHLAERRLTAG